MTVALAGEKKVGYRRSSYKELRRRGMSRFDRVGRVCSEEEGVGRFIISMGGALGAG